jgi:hypothetical protein
MAVNSSDTTLAVVVVPCALERNHPLYESAQLGSELVINSLIQRHTTNQIHCQGREEGIYRVRKRVQVLDPHFSLKS